MKVEKKYILLLLLLPVAGLMLAFKAGEWIERFSIEADAKLMETDRMGNLYLATTGNQLMKYDASGKLLGTLNYAYLGNITHMDVSNPMEIYLFYRELNAVVFLDNNLAYRGRLNLSDAGITQAVAAARTYSNGVWVFDQGDLQLKKLNKDGSMVQSSGNIRQFVKGQDFSPTLIVDDGSRVMMCDSSEGILVFDVFANYIKTIPAGGARLFRLQGSQVYYPLNGSIVRYQLNTLVRDTIVTPQKDFISFCVDPERLTLLSGKGVTGYSWSKP